MTGTHVERLRRDLRHVATSGRARWRMRHSGGKASPHRFRQPFCPWHVTAGCDLSPVRRSRSVRRSGGMHLATPALPRRSGRDGGASRRLDAWSLCRPRMTLKHANTSMTSQYILSRRCASAIAAMARAVMRYSQLRRCCAAASITFQAVIILPRTTERLDKSPSTRRHTTCWDAGSAAELHSRRWTGQ